MVSKRWAIIPRPEDIEGLTVTENLSRFGFFGRLDSHAWVHDVRGNSENKETQRVCLSWEEIRDLVPGGYVEKKHSKVLDPKPRMPI